ncbi:MAG TPA: hypothetical protein VMY34_10955 [Acidimicrobiales bacterium]|nr:hypothetical protein [Acidimicrobiales bacterium]
MTVDRFLPWVLRATWATLPLTAGTLIAGALQPRSDAVATTAGALAWIGWSIGMLASLVPHPISLTALRTLAPAAAATVAAASTARDASLILTLAGVASGAATLVIVFLPSVGERFINGPAYPNERRMLLRLPGPLMFGPLPLAWAALCVGATIGPMMLAAALVPLGAVATVVGWGVAVLMARAVHRLALRWVVFVPAGVVLHDSMAIVDAVLFGRPIVESLAAAPADSDSLDLTRGALGLALELKLREKVPMVLVGPKGRDAEAGASARLLFTPTRPGALLAEAAARRLPTA